MNGIEAKTKLRKSYMEPHGVLHMYVRCAGECKCNNMPRQTFDFEEHPAAPFAKLLAVDSKTH